MKRFTRMKSGDKLTPRHLNAIYAELERLAKIRGDGFIKVDADGIDGPIIHLPTASLWARLVKPSSTIAAISGGTMSQGTAVFLGGVGANLGTTTGTLYPYNAMGTVSGTGTCLAIPENQRWLIVGRYC
jgi:hypothetical protein